MNFTLIEFNTPEAIQFYSSLLYFFSEIGARRVISKAEGISPGPSCFVGQVIFVLLPSSALDITKTEQKLYEVRKRQLLREYHLLFAVQF